MDDTDLRILKEAAKARGHRPTTPEMRARAEALHGDRLLSRTNENGGPWTYRITEKGRAALAAAMAAPAPDAPVSDKEIAAVLGLTNITQLKPGDALSLLQNLAREVQERRAREKPLDAPLEAP